MIVKTVIGFLNNYSDPELIRAVQAMLLALTNNPNFPKTSPTVDVISTSLAEFVTAVSEKAANGGKEQTALKNAKRAALCTLLRRLSMNIDETSNGDYAIMLSSAFPMAKTTRTRYRALPQPTTPVLTYTDVSGEVRAVTKGVEGAVSYSWQLSLASAPTEVVTTKLSVGARVTLSGLTRGEDYLVAVSAVGAQAQSDYSSTAEIMAL